MNLKENLEQINITDERRYDLDWLRVLAVLLLIYFHAAAIFYHGELGEFYIQNNSLSSALQWFIFVVHQWHMPLFFFIAGAATWFSLKLRSAREYIGYRFSRLFIPFIFGTLVLVPPQVYYNRLSHHEYSGSYVQFYPQFFHGIRPQGNFEWAHLWFLIYLFVISLVTLPLLSFLKKQTEQLWYSQVANFLRQPGAILLPALPLAVIEGALRPRWFGFQNLYDDWANVLLYISYFAYGFIFCSHAEFGQAIQKNRQLILGISIITMSVLLGWQASDFLPSRGYSWKYIFYQMFRGVNSWCWVIALVGLGQRYLNFNNGILQYTSQASYPFYLLHQTVLVTLGFYVVQWNLGIPEKFLIISSATILLTGTLYEVLVRRINIIRFLFGLKPIEIKQKE
ncbi:acyltransferase [Nostoc sp. FACHB-152]|uniref:acyltransferase family protein n=1 Tax=unclassified Nostoc TaxID=2593658 RepID=UPI001684B7F1|nr:MULTISPECIES: acyltransferase [unclassified Nostoc]MBD2448441.1 acyltransferase [Nostoc sp. FACHB-152]MBD2472548.1 acyltransferase [Nostoc sp. FACHB-145]